MDFTNVPINTTKGVLFEPETTGEYCFSVVETTGSSNYAEIDGIYEITAPDTVSDTNLEYVQESSGSDYSYGDITSQRVVSLTAGKSYVLKFMMKGEKEAESKVCVRVTPFSSINADDISFSLPADKEFIYSNSLEDTFPYVDILSSHDGEMNTDSIQFNYMGTQLCIKDGENSYTFTNNTTSVYNVGGFGINVTPNGAIYTENEKSYLNVNLDISKPCKT